MRAIRFSQFGDPNRVLSLANVPDPEPGPGEVRVRLTHRPINPSDLLTVQNLYRTSARPPMSPGLEGVGRIDAIGRDVKAFAPGQRVVSLAGIPGTWAERIVIPAERALPIPDAIDDVAAAQLLVNPITAWALVFDDLPLKDGDWLLQTAASSALGRIIIQLARRRNLRTLNVVRRRENVQPLLDAGGDAVVCTADEPLGARVREITKHDGVAAAIDAVGGPLSDEVVRCVRPGGTMCVMGILGGAMLGPIDPRALIFDAVTIRGFWLSEWSARRPPDVINRAFGEMMTLIAGGELRLRAEAEYDLADFSRALEHVNRPARDGKIMLVG
jgi:NADPH2:quinone reductase